MRAKGLCMICGSAVADKVCPKCGRMVCDSCWNKEQKVCVDCAKAKF